MKSRHVISLNKPAAKEARLHWATEPGSAQPGVDYVHSEGEVVFRRGESEKVVEVELISRPSAKLERSFGLRISEPRGVRIATATARASLPPGAGSIGPLIRRGLIANSYHSVLGRGGYFHQNSGTSEGQAVAIEAAFLASGALKGAEPDAAEWYRKLGLLMCDAMGDGSRRGPMLRQAFPANPETITLMHWLFAARGPIPAQEIVYDHKSRMVGGKLRILRRPEDVYRVWMAYPSTSYLLFNSPYSPAYDVSNPGPETQVAITDWSNVGDMIEIPFTAEGDWRIVMGLNNSGVIDQGEAQEAYPMWTKIPDGYSACAPDTFRWLDLAMELARQNDDRPGRSGQWRALRDAMRRTAVKGQNISDLRTVFEALPGFPALPKSGEPSGMFCYSNHPAALPPSDGSNPGWTGYNFWSREPSGDLLATVPSASGKFQVQIGRGFNDSWRTATRYQEADQSLLLTLSVNAAADRMADGKLYAYVSSSKTYSAQTRWYADLSELVTWDALSSPFGAGSVMSIYIPRTAFKRKDIDNAVLPAGQRLENFGLSIEFTGDYRLRMRTMRLVSSNSADAAKGSKMPYFPGAMPFAINADTINQRFVGWNGSPFHGYQLPDFWYALEADAAAVHPGLQASDLVVVDPTTGALVAPIAANNRNGVAKPRHALLMEQQLLFLKHAQVKWAADSGYSGPFAHTLVLNTSARATIGNPEPHTWVYINDDPNTRWAGYQARVVESLAKTAYLTTGDDRFQDCRTMAAEMAIIWLRWLPSAWLEAGVKVAGRTIYGLPTEFNDPRARGVETLYEDPHTAALVLRACIWLKLAFPSDGAFYDAIMVRCWRYLETLWVTSGEMRFTWSPNPGLMEWFGFWHFEIIATLSGLLTSGVRPDAISGDVVKERLLQTKIWLEDIGVQ